MAGTACESPVLGCWV